MGLRIKASRIKHPSQVWPYTKTSPRKALKATVLPPTEKRMLRKAESFVKDWDHKPDFKVKDQSTKGNWSIRLYITGPNKQYWTWTSRGTKPHTIKPRNAASLVFVTGNRPKTSPPGKRKRGGKRTKVFAQVVRHPGTDPRLFEEQIAQYSMPTFQKSTSKALDRLKDGRYGKKKI